MSTASPGPRHGSRSRYGSYGVLPPGGNVVNWFVLWILQRDSVAGLLVWTFAFDSPCVCVSLVSEYKAKHDRLSSGRRNQN
jgi:hypothetical protein